MNSLLQTQFTRVEAALSTLVDSISSYNPSPSAAYNLVAADDALNASLEQCTSEITLNILVKEANQPTDSGSSSIQSCTLGSAT